MKKRKYIYPAFIILAIAGIFFWKQSSISSKEVSGTRGLMTDRLSFVSTANTNADKYIAEMEHQIRENPDNSALYNMLGGAYLQKARETGNPEFYSKAEYNLEKALELDDKNFEAMYQMGALALARHMFNEALEWGKRSVEINSYNGPVRGVIFDAQVELGLYDEALKTVQDMVDTKPDITSYSRVSYYRELIGDINGAISAMRMAVNAGSPGSENTAWCRVQLGSLYLNNGDNVKAENEYQRALTDFPLYYQALSAMGKLMFIKNNTQSAIEFYKKSLEVNPSAEAMIALGDIYRITGQIDLADRQYENVRFMNMLLRENGVDVDMELALFRADHDVNLDEALKDAELSLQKRPTIRSSNTLAWIQYKMGNFSEAEKNISNALRLNTKEPLLYYHAGKIFEKSGQYEKAKEYFDYALNINPHFNELYP